ncbi:MAG: sn-glycerol-3-phosphate ABC transporter ATP-binding protein UgpC, partial [Candidatus Marinimicrobia bacterium]|nr:sn-glycerol-3-phosphate ABC transporter ATP-binding protein UgpC [Candidatus Neomarinimicrobiota bacterium]
GPSGCGKSTTLRMIAGLEEATSGEIYIGDRLVNDVPPKDRDIAMVFQNYALYPHMTVYENMAFGLKLRKYPKKEITDRVNEAADILELGELLDRKPKQLSGGQRQRVALGRAIVRKPKVFLFDEPLSNLDAKLRVQMRTEIKKLHQKLDTTMVYVTHDQVEAMTMGERIVVMKDGIIHQIGHPTDIYQNPQDLFVAGFIGSPAMNFIPGKLHIGAFRNDRNNIVLSLNESVNQAIENRDVILGIRPENLYLNKISNTTQPVQLSLEVVEPLGNESILYFSGLDIQLVLRSNKTQIDTKIGASIPVYFDMDKSHIFDRNTQLVIDI